MKKNLLFGLIGVGMALSFANCKKDSSSDVSNSSGTLQSSISGYAEKGIFLPGATVTVTVYKDNTFATILNTYTTSITSNDGSYSVKGDIKSKYVKVSVSGQFIDETSSSNAQMSGTINAIADASSSKTVNVNALTDMESDAAIEKIKAGKPIAEAKKKP